MNSGEEITLFVDDEGDLSFVYDDELVELLDVGDGRIMRASHVEPTEDNRWTADMSPVGGPILGPFDSRTVALAEEKQWLIEHNLGTLDAE